MGKVSRHFSKRVKDQGDRPTCVAFAVSALHEYWRDVVVAQFDKISLNLSSEFLYYGCKQRDKLATAAGTTVIAASDWLKTKGQCLEELHPYQAAESSPRKPSPVAFADGSSRTVDALIQRQAKWQTLENDLRKELPAVGVISLFDGAYRVTKRGELTLPNQNEAKLGLHAVLFIEIERTGQEQMVLFLNSWGDKWGDGGLGRLGPAYFIKFCKQLWTIERRKA